MARPMPDDAPTTTIDWDGAYALAHCPSPFESPDYELSLVWHLRTDGDPAHEWFRALVEEEVGRLAR